MYTTIIYNPDDLLIIVIFTVLLGITGYSTRWLHKWNRRFHGKSLLLVILGLLTLCSFSWVIFSTIYSARNLGDFAEKTIGIRTPLKQLYFDRKQPHILSADFQLREVYELPENVALQLQPPPANFWKYPQYDWPNYNGRNWQQGPIRKTDKEYIDLPTTLSEDDTYFQRTLGKAGQSIQQGRGYYSYFFNEFDNRDITIFILLPDEKLLIRIEDEL